MLCFIEKGMLIEFLKMGKLLYFSWVQWEPISTAVCWKKTKQWSTYIFKLKYFQGLKLFYRFATNYTMFTAVLNATKGEFVEYMLAICVSVHYTILQCLIMAN